MVDIDALVVEVTKRAGHRKCWVDFIDGDARKFMDGLEAAEDEHPGKVFRKGAAELFAQFDVETNGHDVARHLKRDCLCRPKLT